MKRPGSGWIEIIGRRDGSQRAVFIVAGRCPVIGIGAIRDQNGVFHVDTGNGDTVMLTAVGQEVKPFIAHAAVGVHATIVVVIRWRASLDVDPVGIGRAVIIRITGGMRIGHGSETDSGLAAVFTHIPIGRIQRIVHPLESRSLYVGVCFVQCSRFQLICQIG